MNKPLTKEDVIVSQHYKPHGMNEVDRDEVRSIELGLLQGAIRGLKEEHRFLEIPNPLGGRGGISVKAVTLIEIDKWLGGIQ